MSELVSVIISDLFEKHLPETVQNLKETADGPIEIIVKEDHDSKGWFFFAIFSNSVMPCPFSLCKRKPISPSVRHIVAYGYWLPEPGREAPAFRTS